MHTATEAAHMCNTQGREGAEVIDEREELNRGKKVEPTEKKTLRCLMQGENLGKETE